MDKPIRVLQVMSSMNRGGAETMIMNIYRNIDRSKVQFDFVVHTDKKSDYEDEILSLGGRIFYVPRYTGKNHFAYRKAWKEFFDQHNEYKVIHGHVRSTALIYLSIAKKYEITTIVHSHSASSDKGVKGLLKNLLQLPLRHTADYLFSCSDLAGEWLYGARAIKKDNYFLLKNAVNAEQFDYNAKKREDIRQKFNLADKLVVGHIGRFSYPKNHRFLIEIFKEITLLHENSTLLLVGQGPLMDDIKAKVDNLNLTKDVMFTGLRDDIDELLQAVDIIVFPSFYEGLPVSIIEAQAAGVPCLISSTITKEVVITDLIRQMSIKLDAKSWAKEALEIAYKTKRQSQLQNIIASGYDIDTTSTTLLKFYMSLLNHGGNSE